ncbi:MAG: SPOR domain-containing protein [Candidatus Binatia bacterium]
MSQQGGWPPLRNKKHQAFRPVLIALLIVLVPSSGWPTFSEKRLTARAALLMDAATGNVLFQRKPDVRHPPASTTKVATAIVALEKAKLHNRLRVTKSAAQVPSLRIGLRPGQSMSVQDLLYSTLLYSANDASIVLAEGIAGSVTGFANMMTRKARQVGAKNTRFTNPHGLTARGHYSTARDLALIFNYAMKNPDFRAIVQTKRKTVSLITAGKIKRVRRIPLRNKNRLLWNFNGAVGGKTGYTRAARRCFVGAATRDGVTLVVSILGSRALWTDTRRLLEYGFRNGTQRPSSSNGYIVQIASFRKHNQAESLRKKIMKDGYRAYVERALDNGHTTYRVRIGPYTKRMQAQEAARELKNKSSLRGVVLFASPAASDNSRPPTK